MTVVCRTIKELQAYLKKTKDQREGSIGLVPTMGALHAGHMALVQAAKKECNPIILTIFVNPTQFGPGEDYQKYPRELEKDLNLSKEAGVGCVFAPDLKEIYPAQEEESSTFVEETSRSRELCGKFRPGHFRGVATVVIKLFHMIQPQKAFFGLKDLQQFYVLDKVVKDLNLDIELRGVPTVREADGLAMSSRNQYLSIEEREKAPYFYQCLKKYDVEKGNLAEIKNLLESKGFQVQYLQLVSLPDLRPVHQIHSKGALAGAVFLGSVRLIDNILLERKI